MRGRGGFGGRPILRPGRSLFPGRRSLMHGMGCMGLFFPMLILGAFLLLILPILL
jgi:hypothetical protein